MTVLIIIIDYRNENLERCLYCHNNNNTNKKLQNLIFALTFLLKIEKLTNMHFQIFFWPVSVL